MNTFLVLLSSLLWWVLYSSIGALFVAIIAWAVLRWIERCNVVFNRAYLACLLWMLLSVIVGGAALMKQGAHADPRVLLQAFGWRAFLVLDMLVGAGLLWRLVPRVDARRIKPTSACLVVAVVMLVVFGVGTSLFG